VRLCRGDDRIVAQVAEGPELVETALREWGKRAEIDAGNGPPGALTTVERGADPPSQNAVAERFFATRRAEPVDHERPPTRAAAEASSGEYVGGFDNVGRRHSRLDYLSPGRVRRGGRGPLHLPHNQPVRQSG
jgi:hypothetical protein